MQMQQPSHDNFDDPGVYDGFCQPHYCLTWLGTSHKQVLYEVPGTNYQVLKLPSGNVTESRAESSDK